MLYLCFPLVFVAVFTYDLLEFWEEMTITPGQLFVLTCKKNKIESCPLPKWFNCGVGNHTLVVHRFGRENYFLLEFLKGPFRFKLLV